ncbi:class I SAM-dependent methyltransferase [Desulfobulbus sp. TB]|nr:class I SAM-dependent methyltransferase [Desulfobulbus sp. TB]
MLYSANHYNKLASKYNEIWAKSQNLIDKISIEIIQHLQIDVNHDQIVELGSGTGIYSKAINNLYKPNKNIICVDPSEKMLNKINSTQIKIICKDAISFSINKIEYNKIFMKEVIHHIRKKDLLFKNIYHQLPQNGILLLILLPKEIKNPLFIEALNMYKKLQPDYHDLEVKLIKQGFQVTTDFFDYHMSVDKIEYFKMIKMRYMSFLSCFSDKEIENGINSIKEIYKNDKILSFNYRLVFITAKKI